MTTIHSPTLASIRMVEAHIKKHSQEFTRFGLWKRLPKKMMYQTFLEITKYLQESGKIFECEDGTVIWTWNPLLLKKAHEVDLFNEANKTEGGYFSWNRARERISKTRKRKL